MSFDDVPVELLIAQRRSAEAYERLKGKAHDGHSFELLGRAAWATGRYAEALAAFASANELSPHSDDAATRYAQAFLALGQRGPAREQIAKALQRLPESMKLRYLSIRLALDDSGMAGSRDSIQRLANDAPFAAEPIMLHRALAVSDGKVPPGPHDFGSPKLNAAWSGFLFQRSHPSARLFGTSDALLRYALGTAPFEGLTLEFGVYFGLSLGVIAECTRGLVDGFDSFQGLPEAWVAGEGAGAYSTGGRVPEVAANVRLHNGWFSDTVPPFVREHAGAVRLAHVDCDLYSSTKTVLDAIADRLKPGSIIVFDDFQGFPESERHEFRAWTELVAERHLAFEYLGFVLLGRAAAVVIA